MARKTLETLYYTPEHGKSRYRVRCDCGCEFDFYCWSSKKKCPRCGYHYTHYDQAGVINCIVLIAARFFGLFDAVKGKAVGARNIGVTTRRTKNVKSVDDSSALINGVVIVIGGYKNGY